MNTSTASEAAVTKFDVVYFFHRGEWKPADPFCPVSLGGAGGDIDLLVTRLESAGYPAVKGLRSVGAPEGAPECFTSTRKAWA
jgi:hypothetical protein